MQDHGPLIHHIAALLREAVALGRERARGLH